MCWVWSKQTLYRTCSHQVSCYLDGAGQLLQKKWKTQTYTKPDAKMTRCNQALNRWAWRSAAVRASWDDADAKQDAIHWTAAREGTEQLGLLSATSIAPWLTQRLTWFINSSGSAKDERPANGVPDKMSIAWHAGSQRVFHREVCSEASNSILGPM